MKCGDFPRGHPDVLVSSQIDLKQMASYSGVMKVKILPPRRLHIPVLPLRVEKKLLFGLCRKCCIEMSKNPCSCSDEDRSWIGSYHTSELKLAMEKGYVILTAYELHNFPEDRRCVYNPETPGAGLFEGYINIFLKMKQESSGFPQGVVTEEEKRAYVADYHANEGIALDMDRITVNPGRRFLAKLYLNSLWGFMAMKEMRTSVETHSRGDFHKFHRRISDPTLSVKRFSILSSQTVMLEYSQNHDFVVNPSSNNLYVAVYTTALARLKLYEALDRAGANTLYCDTDSIVFSESLTRATLSTGNYLGQLTSEIDGDQAENYIRYFVSAGAKNYAYQTTSGDEVVKVKGFTLHYTNAQRVNFGTMKQLVTEQLEDGVIETTHPHSIRRDLQTLKIYSRDEVKKYAACVSKRVFNVDEFTSKPYGF